MARTILIVEDDKLLAEGLDIKLKYEGFTTTLASDGAEALKLLETQRFDIILLDLVMPTMDGFEMLKLLRKKDNPPKVFVLTNLSQPEAEARVNALGAERLFIKSDTSLDVIVKAIKQA